MEVILLKDGPILITEKDKKIALCRCGLSNNKPRCDGSHKGCNLPEGVVREGEFIEAKEGDC